MRSLFHNGQQIGLVHELTTYAAALHHARPTHQQRHPVAPFPNITLVATPRPARKMTLLLQFDRAGVRGFSVVAGENDQGVIRRATLLECVQNPAHDVVGLHHKIGISVKAAPSQPRGGHGHRFVGGGQRQVKQEGHVTCQSQPHKAPRRAAGRTQPAKWRGARRWPS